MGRRRRQSSNDLPFEGAIRLGVGFLLFLFMLVAFSQASAGTLLAPLLGGIAELFLAVLAIAVAIAAVWLAWRYWPKPPLNFRRDALEDLPRGRILDPGAIPLPETPVPAKPKVDLSSLTALRDHLAVSPDPFPPAPTVHPFPFIPTPPAMASAGLSAPDLTDKFRNLDWYQFEKIVALICGKIGYEVERRGGAHADGGIDLLLRQDGQTQGVQCKHWKTWQVGVKSVREFLGALTAAGLQEGVFISLGKFTPDAAALASRHNIQLVDAAGLADLVEQAGVRCDPEFVAALHDPRKYCPKCERELVLRTATKGLNCGGQFWGCSAYPRCKFILRT